MPVSDEKIKEAEEIEKIRKSRQDLEAAVASLPEIDKKYDKLINELCEGPDCLKNKVQEKFVSIDNKFKKIDDSLSTFFVCENCGYDRVQGLSSYCPQCGNPIYEWNDDDGKPIKGWVPFVDRSKK